MSRIINFINLSDACRAVDVAFFNRDIVPGQTSTLLWKVISHCGFGNNHPFPFPIDSEVAVRDAWGNYTPTGRAHGGDVFTLEVHGTGTRCRHERRCVSVREIQVANALPRGAVDALLYKDGRPFAQKTVVAPGQKASFREEPVLWVGAGEGLREGSRLDTAELPAKLTRLMLHAVATVDLIMIGGGGGGDAQPFSFVMENITTNA